MVKTLRDSKLSRFLFTLITAGAISTQVSAQSIPYVETMGNVSGVTQIAAHTFDLQVEGLVYQGNADVRNVLTSSGYNVTNKDGAVVQAASASANVFISNIVGKYIQVSNLSTNSPEIPAEGAFLRFACIKANTYSNGIELVVEYSINGGTTWVPLSFPVMPTGSGTNIWRYRQSTNRIPKSENVMLRFRNSSDWVQFRIDDITFDIAKKCTKPVLTASGPTEFCEGGAVTLTSTTSHANAYQWRKDGVNIPGATATSYTANESGSYTLTATESDASGRSCIITSDPVVVTKNPNPTVTIANNGPFCNGANVTLTATAANGSGNYGYQWKDNADANLAGETNATLSFTNVAAGTYTYKVLVNDLTKGCVGTVTSHTFTVNTNPSFTITSNRTITSNATEICAGNTWDVSLNASGGAGPYQYTRNFNNGAQINTDGTSSYNFSNAGSYAFSVRDANNCTSAVQTVALSVNSNPNVSISGANAYCQGGTAALTANPAGGTPGYTYLWSNTATTQAVNVTSGNYTVTVTDTKGCTGTSASHTVNENANPTVNVTGNGNFGGFEYCQGGNVELTASGSSAATPISYSWTNGAATAATTVTAGSYTVTVTDANNCTVTASRTVVENLNPTVGISGNGAGGSSTQFEYCNGETLTLTAGAANGTPGYTYSWNSGAGTASTFDVTGASATHTVVVTDAKLCTATANQAVTRLENPTVSVTGNGTPTGLEYCEGTGGITLTAAGSGGNGTYNFSWSSGESTAIILNKLAASYTVTISDSKACSGNTSVTVVENANPTISISGDGNPGQFERCVGTAITLTGNALGGSGSYASYTWTNGQGISGNTATYDGSSGNISDISVRVTDTKGCIGNSAPVGITANALPVVTGFSGNGSPNPLAFCTSPASGIDVTATVSSGTTPYTFAWTSGLTMADATVNPVAVSGGNVGANNLSLTVTDAKGCTGSNNVNVSRNANPTLSINKTFVPGTNEPTNSCLGGVEFLVNYGSQALNMQSDGVAAHGGALTYQNSFVGGSLGATDFSLPATGATPNLFLNTPQTAPTNVSGTPQNGTTAVYGKRTVQVIVTEGNTGCTATETVDVKIVDARVNATNNLYYCQNVPVLGDQQGSAPKATVQSLKTAQPNNVCVGNCTDKGQTAARGAAVFTTEKSGIAAFPNPFDNQLTVGFELGQEEKVTVMITDALGRVVKTQQSVYPQGYSEYKWNTDVQPIAAGTYYIQVVSNSINFTTKVLKN